MGPGRFFVAAAMMMMPLVSGCEDRFSAARDFYSKNVTAEAQAKAIKTYDSRTKWLIYSYGLRQSVAHSIKLGPVIAEDGKPVLDAVMEDLDKGVVDISYYSGAILISDIQHDKRYNVCADHDSYGKLLSYAAKIKTPAFKESYTRQLSDMCAAGGG